MGAFLARLWARFTEFPIKIKPICFHLQKNFMSTGDKKAEDQEIQTDAYDELQKAFIRKLTEVGDKRDKWLRENFTQWDQITVDDLTNNFMLLASEENGMMDFKKL